ncbi:MAG: hypothetical protein WDA74_07890 [Spirochaetota bacterium]
MSKIKKKKKKTKTFRELLEKYLEIKGLDIVVILNDGTEVELYKNREIINDIIIAIDNSNKKQSIPITEVKSVDLFAA